MDAWDEVTEEVPEPRNRRGRKKSDTPGDEFLAAFLEGNESFARDRFYTRSKSSDGTNYKATITLPSAYAVLIEKIVKSDTNPLTLPSEVTRHAFAYGLLHLAEMAAKFDPQIHDQSRRIMVMEQLEAKATLQLMYGNEVKAFNANLELLSDRGLWDQVRETILDMELVIDDYPAWARDEIRAAIDNAEMALERTTRAQQRRTK